MSIPLPDRNHAPSVPPVVRTVAYYVALVAGAVGVASIGVAAAVWPEHAATVAAVSGSATGAIATIAGGLGVVYRPTVEPRRAITPADPEVD